MSRLDYFPLSVEQEGSCNTPPKFPRHISPSDGTPPPAVELQQSEGDSRNRPISNLGYSPHHQTFDGVDWESAKTHSATKALEDALERSPYTVKLDYLVLVVDAVYPDSVFHLIEDLKDIFMDGFEFFEGTKFTGRNYDGGWAQSSYVIQVMWDDFYKTIEKGKSPTIRVSIPGRALSRVTPVDLAIWFNGLKHCNHIRNIRCTRLDAAFDDFTQKLFSERDLYEAWQNENIIRLTNGTHDSRYSGSPKDGISNGWTHQWGGGRKHIVFYNKEAESGGEVKSHRCEVRYREVDATLAFNQWLQIPIEDFEELSIAFLSGLIVGVCDFMEFPKGRRHGVRDGVRLPWWEKVCEIANGVLRFSRQVTRTNYERKKAWIEKQVVTSLSQLQDVMSYDDFRDWLQDKMHFAREKYQQVHRAWIYATRKDKELGYST